MTVRTGDAVTVKARAKINLYLHVLGRRVEVILREAPLAALARRRVRRRVLVRVPERHGDEDDRGRPRLA